MTKPILLLDIDGVINAFAFNFPIEDADHDVLMDGYRIVIPGGTAERIEILSDYFEMHWGTMWMERAHPAFQEILGLSVEPWPHVDFSAAWFRMRRSGGRAETHKLECVEVYANDLPDRPIVWVDDDIGISAQEWAAERPNTKVLRVDPRTGLTDTHVDELIEFAKEHSNG